MCYFNHSCACPLQWFLVCSEGDKMAVCVIGHLLQANRDVEETGKEVCQTLRSVNEAWWQGLVEKSPRRFASDRLERTDRFAVRVASCSVEEEIQISFLWREKNKFQRQGTYTASGLQHLCLTCRQQNIHRVTVDENSIHVCVTASTLQCRVLPRIMWVVVKLLVKV